MSHLVPDSKPEKPETNLQSQKRVPLDFRRHWGRRFVCHPFGELYSF